MSGVSLINYWVIIFLIVGVCVAYTIEHSNVLQLNVSPKSSNNFSKINNKFTANTVIYFSVLWHFLNYFTLKINTMSITDIYPLFNVYTYLFLITFFLNISFLNIKNNQTSNYSYFQSIVILLFICLYLCIFCDNYIVLLLLVELITTIYYFFFLKNSTSQSFSLIKYKNLISYYLWLSFFTLILFSLCLIGWVYLYGTLNIYELRTFKVDIKFCFLIFVAFFWKLGVPLFHFFKLELYRYLDFISLLIFSLVSLVINSFLFIYVLYILDILSLYNTYIFILITIINFILLMQSVDKIYFFYFFAISGLNTWLFFIIISIS